MNAEIKTPLNIENLFRVWAEIMEGRKENGAGNSVIGIHHPVGSAGGNRG